MKKAQSQTLIQGQPEPQPPPSQVQDPHPAHRFDSRAALFPDKNQEAVNRAYSYNQFSQVGDSTQADTLPQFGTAPLSPNLSPSFVPSKPTSTAYPAPQDKHLYQRSTGHAQYDGYYPASQAQTQGHAKAQLQYQYQPSHSAVQAGQSQPQRNHQSQRPPFSDHWRGYDTRQICASQSVVYLDLYTFKIDQCQQDPQNHNLKRCPFYHDFHKDRRRPLGSHQSEICPSVVSGRAAKCSKGDACDRAHNRVEEFYHPDKYKAKFCSSYLESGGTPCDYQEFCSFAHSERELSIELIEKYKIDMDYYMFLFKTVWCPYREDDHDRKICVYAHNWQDFRRRPSTFTYQSKMCPNWQVNNFISSYQEGCPNQYQCMYSHGWKEQEYHPNFLKTKQCQHGANCKKSHCPYYHSEYDRQAPVSKWFNFFPQSRITAFQTNFYVQSYGTKQNFVANKQTSFSCLPTQIICNQGRLNGCHGNSPESASTRSDTNTSAKRGKKQQPRSNQSTGSRHLTDAGSQNSVKKGKARPSNQKPYNHSQQINTLVQSQPHSASAQQSENPLNNRFSGSQQYQGSHTQHSQPLQQNSYPKVKFEKPLMIQNHFASPPQKETLSSGEMWKGPVSLVSQLSPPNFSSGNPVPQQSSQTIDSPTKLQRSAPMSNNSFSLSNQESSYQGSANNSAHSAQLGTTSNQGIGGFQGFNQGNNLFVRNYPQPDQSPPDFETNAAYYNNQDPSRAKTEYNFKLNPTSADPYTLKKRTTSYGMTDQRHEFQSNLLGTAAQPNFGSDSHKKQDNFGSAGTQGISYKNDGGSLPFDKSLSSRSLIYQTNPSSQLGGGGQAAHSVLNSTGAMSMSNNASGEVSYSAQSSPNEESKTQDFAVKNGPIEEEGTSNSSSEQVENHKQGAQSMKASDPSQKAPKKRGLLSKVQRGLQSLSIRKSSSASKDNQKCDPVELFETDSDSILEKDCKTYVRDHPKSATLKRNTLFRRTSGLAGSVILPERLHSIKEEKQLLEESQRFPRSQSGHRKRSGTPDFVIDDHNEIDQGDSDDNPEEDKIIANMEAQIANFDE